MLNSFKNTLIIIAFVIGGYSLLLGCATQNKNVYQPPAGKIGQISKFDITRASQEDIAAALQRDGRVVISGGILFDFDSAKLTPSAEEVGNKIADVMKQNPDLKVAVVGHTDNTGDFKYNIKLSERRANAIVNLLVKDGVAANRLAGVGVGSLSPIASNDTKEGQAENRRVELVLIR